MWQLQEKLPNTEQSHIWGIGPNYISSLLPMIKLPQGSNDLLIFQRPKYQSWGLNQILMQWINNLPLLKQFLNLFTYSKMFIQFIYHFQILEFQILHQMKSEEKFQVILPKIDGPKLVVWISTLLMWFGSVQVIDTRIFAWNLGVHQPMYIYFMFNVKDNFYDICKNYYL